MTSNLSFDPYIRKLSQNVYGSVKGAIRLTLLKKDIEECCDEFNSRKLAVLDVGCGEGAFSQFCVDSGHAVCLLDASERMIETATRRFESQLPASDINLICTDFLSWHTPEERQYDLVLMHGSAEWMSDATLAIEKGCQFVKPGGFLSLLMFNKDVFEFKKGINGHLCGNDRGRKRKLVPPQAQAVDETTGSLQQLGGRIVLQSGIRVFHDFFRQTRSTAVSEAHWLAQELAYYRRRPFCFLGQHTHFIWKKEL